MMTLNDLQFKFKIGDVVRHKAASKQGWSRDVNYFVIVRFVYEDAKATHLAYRVRAVRVFGEADEASIQLWENELELASDAQPEAKA
jgi:hypothetical protein